MSTIALLGATGNIGSRILDEALARGHVFNDANKRTALACSLAYLDAQGIRVRADAILEDATVMPAEGTWSFRDFAWLLGLLAGIWNPGEAA